MGPLHPDTATIRNNYNLLLQMMKRYRRS
nr:hypothetical protein [Ktedonobacter racemifer]